MWHCSTLSSARLEEHPRIVFTPKLLIKSFLHKGTINVRVLIDINELSIIEIWIKNATKAKKMGHLMDSNDNVHLKREWIKRKVKGIPMK